MGKFDIKKTLKNGALLFLINILAGLVSGIAATALGVGAIFSALLSGAIPSVGTVFLLIGIVLLIHLMALGILYSVIFRR